MKVALNGFWKWLAGGLMALLGFSGCDKIGLFRTEYGSPHADYKLVGDVKDAKGKGIGGIRVVFRPYADENNHWGNDTLYTDARGHFEKDRLKHMWPDDLQNTSVKFEDVDGTANGAFRTKVLQRGDLEVKQTRKGDKNWYSGEFTVHADAVLEEEN